MELQAGAILVTILAVILLGGVAATATIPMSVSAMRGSEQLAQLVVARVTSLTAGTRDLDMLEPTVAKAWRDLKWDSDRGAQRVPDALTSWARALLAFQSLDPLRTEKIENQVVARLSKVEAGLERKLTRPDLTTDGLILLGAKWVRRATLRLALHGLLTFGPKVAMFTVQEVANVVSGVTIGALVISIISVPIVGLYTGVPPDESAYISFAGTWGSVAGLAAGAVTFALHTRRRLQDHKQARAVFYLVWLLVLLMAAALTLTVVFDRISGGIPNDLLQAVTIVGGPLAVYLAIRATHPVTRVFWVWAGTAMTTYGLSFLTPEPASTWIRSLGFWLQACLIAAVLLFYVVGSVVGLVLRWPLRNQDHRRLSIAAAATMWGALGLGVIVAFLSALVSWNAPLMPWRESLLVGYSLLGIGFIVGGARHRNRIRVRSRHSRRSEVESVERFDLDA